MVFSIKSAKDANEENVVFLLIFEVGSIRPFLCLASEVFSRFPEDEFIKTADGLVEVLADSLQGDQTCCLQLLSGDFFTVVEQRLSSKVRLFFL